MILKFKKTDGSKFMVPRNNITITDDHGNPLGAEIQKMTIHIDPDDIVRATCQFSISDVVLEDEKGNIVESNFGLVLLDDK